jgi:cytochrome P450
MSYASANRDPSVFSTPEQFRLDRPLNELRRHMAFGVGAHSCPGSTLARLEMHLTLEAFVERLPNLRLAGPAERVDNYGFWGRSTLPLTW